MLTVYGIETSTLSFVGIVLSSLQQCLPFTVLKHVTNIVRNLAHRRVATVLTVYGIETTMTQFTSNIVNFVATVLTVYGIETRNRPILCHLKLLG